MGLKGSDRFPDILLKNGDSLFIPKKPQEVTVLGEVPPQALVRIADGVEMRKR